MDNTITVNMENLSEEERKRLIELVKKANSNKKREMWKPKIFEEYYTIFEKSGVGRYKWRDDFLDHGCLSIGNCFRTKEEAEFELERLKVIAEMKRFAYENNDEINWDDIKQTKWLILYDYAENNIKPGGGVSWKACDIYFSSEKIALDCVAEIGVDRIKKYYLRVEE